MINPTFASFKNTHGLQTNIENRERSKEVYYKKLQPKTFQELKNITKSNQPHQDSHVYGFPHKPYTPNYIQIKKSYSKLTIGFGTSVQGSGTKIRPDLPSKHFVTAKKEPQDNCHKIERVARPAIISPSILKNRSFIQSSTRPLQLSHQNRDQRPTEGKLTSMYKLGARDSYDSFDDRSDEINRSRESDDYACFNSSKIMGQDEDLKDSYGSNHCSQHSPLNFSRKNSHSECFGDGSETTNKKEETKLTVLPHELSSLSMIPCELTSSIQSETSLQSAQSTTSKNKKQSLTFHKKANCIRRNRESEQIRRKMSLNQFQLLDEIGEGKYGKVYMAQHRVTGFLCALKTVSKARIREEDIEEPFIRQIKIQMYLNHPHIVKLYGFFADQDNIYLVMECCVSGHLLGLMKEKKIFEESEIVGIIGDVFEAVSFIHCHGVIHRDLKPENIVIQHGVYKLCDFGWAAYAKGDSRTTFCGTPLYVCPEILKGQQYDEKADVWGLGVLTYELAYGRVPFPIWSQTDMVKIVKDPVYFPSWTTVSQKMQVLIKTMLNKDPARRLSLNQILSNPLLSDSRNGPRPYLRSEIQLLF